MTPEQAEVIRCAYRWADGRDGSSIELANAVRAMRMAEAREASVRQSVRRAAGEGIRASAADRERG